MAGRYAFGDSDLAAERLLLLARLFEPSSRAFLDRGGNRGGRLGIDLGCGPGETTRLLAETLAPRRAVGLDSSGAHVRRAAAAHPAIEFIRHDATATPFPAGPADVVYARFLLSHLQRPEAVVGEWTGQLAAGGRLLLEEVEAIETDNRVLARYLEVLATLMRGRGQQLYVGRSLARLAEEGRRIAASRATPVEPGAGQAARLFSMNLATWGPEAVAEGAIAAAEAERLADDLAALAAEPGSAAIEWTLRQVALEPA